MSRKRRRRAKKRRPVVLVFGESENDRSALRHLLLALRDDCPKVETRRRPMVLIKGRKRAEQRKAASSLAEVVRADRARRDVRLVVVHEDADAVEPADEQLADDMLAVLSEEGLPAVPAVPAWEMEAWWYQWPDAVLAVNSKWRHPNRQGRHVGKLERAKERLVQDLRPKKQRTRDYEESDSPEIAKHVREQGTVDTLAARSDSWTRFAQRFREAKL